MEVSGLNLVDKIVIITGGANGIGRGTCLEFAKEGAHVVCADINEAFGKELLGDWKEITEKTKSSGTITFIQMDAAKDEDCKRLVDETISRFHRVDVLFNNVGIQPKESNKPIHLLDDDTWDLLFNVNLKSAFRMSKYVIPHMLKVNKGSIINNASIQGIHSQKSVPAYAATKGGLLSLTRQMACEYGKNNIRVNAVSPGSVMSALMRANTDVNYVEVNTPMKSVGEPSDIAKMVTFLASDNSKWITGQNMVVDGGITIKGGWASLE